MSQVFVQYWARTLAVETEPYNITTLLLEPSYVCTNMVQFSDKLNKPSFSVPSPSTYVKSSLSTLGWTKRTTGYWPHSMSSFIISKILAKSNLNLKMCFPGCFPLPDSVLKMYQLRLRNNSPGVEQRTS